MKRLLSPAALLLITLLLPVACGSDDATPGGNRFSDRLLYMPPDTVVAMQVDVKRIARSPEIRGWIEQKLGKKGALDISKLEPLTFFSDQQPTGTDPSFSIIGNPRLADQILANLQPSAPAVSTGKHKLQKLQDNAFVSAGKMYTVAGSQELVTKVLDRIDANPVKLSARAKKFLSCAAAVDDAQVQVAVVLNSRMRQQLQQQIPQGVPLKSMADALRSLQSIALGASYENKALTVKLVINSADKAQLKQTHSELGLLLNMVKSFAAGGGDPRFATAGKILESLRMKLKGNLLTVSASIPEELFLNLGK